jgi:hypothetical protein
MTPDSVRSLCTLFILSLSFPPSTTPYIHYPCTLWIGLLIFIFFCTLSLLCVCVVTAASNSLESLFMPVNSIFTASSFQQFKLSLSPPPSLPRPCSSGFLLNYRNHAVSVTDFHSFHLLQHHPRLYTYLERKPDQTSNMATAGYTYCFGATRPGKIGWNKRHFIEHR